MLTLSSLDYDDHKDLDYRITEFVNDVLSEVVQVVIEFYIDQKALSGEIKDIGT